MGKKINIVTIFIFCIFVFLACIFYYPIFLGKIPLNGNLLMAFWSPWKYEKFSEFPTGVPFKYMGVDEVREFFPILDFTYDSIKNGEIPLWNPYNFSGYPHMANWAATVFYPLHIVLFFLTKLQVFAFLKISAIALSGFFTYLYLRSLLLDRKSAVFGGLVFALSSPMLIWGAEIWQSVHSFLWLPLTLFSIEKIFATKKILYVFIGAFALASSIMGGYIQPSIYLLLICLLYIIFRIKTFGVSFTENNNRRLFLLLILISIFGFGFSAIHTFPAVEAYLLSPRRDIALTQVNLDFLLPLYRIVTFFAPDIFGHITTKNWFAERPGQYYEQMIYIGIVPLVFSFFSFFLKKHKKYALFFLCIGVLFLSLTFNLPTSRLVYDFSIPFLSSAIPIRSIFVVAFSVSVLSAFGCSWWFNAAVKDKKKLFLSLVPLICIYGAIGMWLLLSFVKKTSIQSFPPDWYIVSARNFVIPSIVFATTTVLVVVGYFVSFSRSLFYYLFCFLTILHAFLFAQKYFVFSDMKFFYPKTTALSFLKENIGFSRFWGYGEGVLENNFATVYRLYSPEGYDPVNIKRYNELLSAANTGKFTNIASRSDALIPHTDLWPTQDANPYRLKLLDFLGVKYVVAKIMNDQNVNAKNERFTKVFDDGKFSIFQNKKAFNRVFLVPKTIYAKSDTEAIGMVLDPKINLAEQMVLQEDVASEKLKNTQGKSTIIKYSPNKVIVSVLTDEQQFLVLTDNFYPGWKASIDGVDTRIYRANYTFRAVKVPKGEHEVVFIYDPITFRAGAIVSLGSICVALLILLYNKKVRTLR